MGPTAPWSRIWRAANQAGGRRQDRALERQRRRGSSISRRPRLRGHRRRCRHHVTTGLPGDRRRGRHRSRPGASRRAPSSWANSRPPPRCVCGSCYSRGTLDQRRAEGHAPSRPGLAPGASSSVRPLPVIAGVPSDRSGGGSQRRRRARRRSHAGQFPVGVPASQRRGWRPGRRRRMVAFAVLSVQKGSRAPHRRDCVQRVRFWTVRVRMGLLEAMLVAAAGATFALLRSSGRSAVPSDRSRRCCLAVAVGVVAARVPRRPAGRCRTRVAAAGLGSSGCCAAPGESS